MQNKNDNICEWILCPVCSNKTRIKVFNDTKIIKLPLFCPKCKKETLINVRKGNVEIIHTSITE